MRTRARTINPASYTVEISIEDAERIHTIAWAMQRLLERGMEPSGVLVGRLTGFTQHRVARHWAEAVRELKSQSDTIHAKYSS